MLFSVVREHHCILNGVAQAQFAGSSGSRLVKGGSVIYRYADDRKSQRNIHARNGIPRMFLLLLGFQSLTVIAKNLCDLLQIKLDIFSFSPENWTDSDLLLDNMKEQGYKTVICDLIPYHSDFQRGKRAGIH